MSAKLNRWIKEKMKLDVIQGYGLTECQPVTCNYLDSNKPETLGLPLHGVQVRVLDERGRDCEIGEVGELLIKTPQNAVGYYKNKRDTMKVLKNGWLHTGDYGRVDEDGYVYFEGWKKGVVKVAGNAVDIAELRSRILSFEQVEDVRLDIQEDAKIGHRIKAMIRDNKNGDDFTVEDLRRFLREQLSGHKIPSEFLGEAQRSG